jgi:hypothetical protein
MTHNNGFYHKITNPITSAVKITVKFIVIKMTTTTIDLFATFLHPSKKQYQSTRVMKGNEGLKDDQNGDQCSPEAPLCEELKREKGKR